MSASGTLGLSYWTMVSLTFSMHTFCAQRGRGADRCVSESSLITLIGVLLDKKIPPRATQSSVAKAVSM